jgi:protein-L-isoaspartate(D-aspartate) O-methyltransferase
MKWRAYQNQSPFSEADFAAQREHMVQQQIKRRGVQDERLINALRLTPRHLFLPERYRHAAYEDTPVPIGFNQTISQPYIVAFMVEWLKLKDNVNVLEIGAGSGYQTAVLAQLCKSVYSIEIVPELATRCSRLLQELGCGNAHVRCGDGYAGWMEHAPFDGIIVSAAPTQVPERLVEQLAPGGRMILPLGVFDQALLYLYKDRDGTVHRQQSLSVKFVPMTGLAEQIN